MLAHLVERFHGMEEVRSSSLLHSTIEITQPFGWVISIAGMWGGANSAGVRLRKEASEKKKLAFSFPSDDPKCGFALANL